MKTVDLTLRQIIEMCTSNKCITCPLYHSMLECWKFDKRHKNSDSYDVNTLMSEEIPYINPSSDVPAYLNAAIDDEDLIARVHTLNSIGVKVYLHKQKTNVDDPLAKDGCWLVLKTPINGWTHAISEEVFNRLYGDFYGK